MVLYDSTQGGFQHPSKRNGIHETELQNQFSTALASLWLGNNAFKHSSSFCEGSCPDLGSTCSHQ